jgi:hypothetical protein
MVMAVYANVVDERRLGSWHEYRYLMRWMQVARQESEREDKLYYKML